MSLSEKIARKSTKTDEFINQIYLEDFHLETIENLFKFKNENLFTDVYIYVEGVEFPCHKVVLCASSFYFKAMFSCDLKESRLGKVYIENISPWTMKRLLDFIYTGRIEINYENVIDLFNAAVLFQLYKLADKCINYVKHHIDLNNCIEINQFASLHNLVDLEAQTFQFILENFMQLINISLNLTTANSNNPINQISSSLMNQIEDLDQLNEIFYSSFVRLSEKTFTDLLKSDLLNVTKEIYVYYAINKWIEFFSLNNNASKSKLSRSLANVYESLFKYLRLNALVKEEIEFILNNDKYIKLNVNLTKILKKQLENFNESDLSNFSNKPSPVKEQIDLKALNCGYSNRLNQIRNIRPSTLPREYLCMMSIDQFNLYDFYKSKWDVLTSWPPNSNKVRSKNKFDEIHDERGEEEASTKLINSSLLFSNTPSLMIEIEKKTRLNGYSTCCINNILYVLGGYRSDDCLTQTDNLNLVDSVYKFDPTKNEWSTCRPMLQKRAFHLSLTLNTSKSKSKISKNSKENFIFNLYGLSYSNNDSFNLVQCLTIEFYNIELDQWSVLNLNNSLLSHHIFSVYNQYNRALLMENDNQETLNQNDGEHLKKLINLQITQSQRVVSLKYLIYILNENCIHCYEFDSKQEQLVCLPYFRLPNNLNGFVLGGAMSVKTPNVVSSLCSDGETQCKTLFSWYSDSEESCQEHASMSSRSSLLNLNESNQGADFSSFEASAESEELDLSKRVVCRQEKEALIFIINAQQGILYEFYPAKNKLVKLPNLLLKHAQTNTFIIQIKSKLYVTGGYESEISDDGSGPIIEIFDQETKTWSIFMNVEDKSESSSDHASGPIHLMRLKHFFKLKMSLV